MVVNLSNTENRARYGLSLVCLSLVVLSMSACTTSPKVEVAQHDDAEMSCAQLEQEFERLDTAQSNIVKNRDSGSVAGFLFWLPGVAYSKADADQALALVQERRQRLRNFYEAKGC